MSSAPDEHLGVAFIALSNAQRELEEKEAYTVDWEDRVRDMRDKVESLLIEVRESNE